MEKLNRKANRLPDYDYGLEGSYFVTLCTQNRANLFQMENAVAPGNATWGIPYEIISTPTVGNGPCAVPQGTCAVPRGPRAVPRGTCAVPKPAPENQIIHTWIKKTEQNFPNISIDTYIIMPDHLHLIVTIRERHAGRSLPDVMHFFKTMTTNAYIRSVKEGISKPFDKKLWQKSYYDHVVRNQRDYNETWEYIQNNPVKWMLMHND